LEEIFLSNKNSNQQKNKAVNSAEGSGTAYHQEHASNIPDYGGNTVDPNAHALSNKTDTTIE
jgi:hypothetical protein